MYALWRFQKGVPFAEVSDGYTSTEVSKLCTPCGEYRIGVFFVKV